MSCVFFDLFPLILEEKNFHFRVSRLYRRNVDKPRLLGVKLAFYSDKEKILAARSNLAGSNLFINESYVPRVRRDRSILWKHFKPQKRDGARVRLVFDKISVDGTLYEVHPITGEIVYADRRNKIIDGGLMAFSQIHGIALQKMNTNGMESDVAGGEGSNPPNEEILETPPQPMEPTQTSGSGYRSRSPIELHSH